MTETFFADHKNELFRFGENFDDAYHDKEAADLEKLWRSFPPVMGRVLASGNTHLIGLLAARTGDAAACADRANNSEDKEIWVTLGKIAFLTAQRIAAGISSDDIYDANRTREAVERLTAETRRIYESRNIPNIDAVSAGFMDAVANACADKNEVALVHLSLGASAIGRLALDRGYHAHSSSWAAIALAGAHGAIALRVPAPTRPLDASPAAAAPAPATR